MPFLSCALVSLIALAAPAITRSAPASAGVVIASVAPASTGSAAIASRTWDARAVEHLLNRAGFGARPEEIEAGVAMGQAALVEKLVDKRAEVEPFFVEDLLQPDFREMSD